MIKKVNAWKNASNALRHHHKASSAYSCVSGQASHGDNRQNEKLETISACNRMSNELFKCCEESNMQPKIRMNKYLKVLGAVGRKV